MFHPSNTFHSWSDFSTLISSSSKWFVPKHEGEGLESTPVSGSFFLNKNQLYVFVQGSVSTVVKQFSEGTYWYCNY